MASNFNFTGAGPYTILERDTDVLVTDTGTGVVSPIGKGVCRVEYDTSQPTPAEARPARQGSDMGPIYFPRLGLVTSITDKDGNALPFATITQYVSSLGIILNNGSSSGGSGGTTIVPNLYLDTGTNGTVTTSATGATFVALAAAACRVVTIFNTDPAAVDIEVALGAATAGVPLPAGSQYSWPVTANASDVKVRRLDLNNTQVTISYFINTPSA